MQNPTQKFTNYTKICTLLEQQSSVQEAQDLLPVVEFVRRLYPDSVELSYLTCLVLLR